MHIIVLASFVSAALACQTGYGDLSKKATISFTIGPPVEWTYGEGETSMGQAYSSGTASTRIKTDITSAIRQSLPSGVSSSSITVTPKYTPTLAILNLTCDDERKKNITDPATPVYPVSAELNSFAVSRGTVFQRCGDKATATSKPTDTPLTTTGSVQLSSTTAFYESQWEDIMLLVQDKLEIKNVEFVNGPTLSLN